MSTPKIFLSAFLLLIAVHGCSQTVPTQTEKLASLCKVWGFLKYYHPGVARGKQDWDQQLLDHIELVRAAHSDEELSEIYAHWITDLGKVAERRHARKPIADSLMLNHDLQWMDRQPFSPAVSEMLHSIEQNKKGRRNYYVRNTAFTSNVAVFRHEKPYADSSLPSPSMRLLCLFRYWNMICYYFPCKYACDKNWETTLNEMIPVFLEADDMRAYARAISKVVARTDDSHGEVFSPATNVLTPPSKTLPFRYMIIENKAVVTELTNDSLAQIDDIRVDDVILSADGRSIQDIFQEKSVYVPASNFAEKIFKTGFQSWFFWGPGDSLNITFMRNGETSTKQIRKYLPEDLHFDWAKKKEGKALKIIDDTIGYVDLELLRNKHVRSMMKQMKGTRVLIFDLRNYPLYTSRRIARHLNESRKPFVKFSITSARYPGINKYDYVQKCGIKRRNYYSGRVVVLHNAESQSFSELSVMILKTAEKTTCIGSQTAGADGATTKVVLPGGFGTRFSNCAVFYPNGQSLVRIGLMPDIEVHQTLKGVLAHKDEVLDRALEFARTGK